MTTDNQFFMLVYTYAPDYMERRTEFRKQHVVLAEEFLDQGYMVLGGATEDPPDSAYICFQCPDRSFVEDFVSRDPYVLNGLVVEHAIRDWKVVVGSLCPNPVKSSDM